MRKRTTAVAAAAVALLLAACTGAPDDVALVDTASVLFPVHVLREDVVEEQKAAFRAGLKDLGPRAEGVRGVAAVRTGPGETFEVVDTLTPGEQVVVDGQVGHWLRLADLGGYVSALHVRATPWETWVAGTGDEELLDACPGGLVDFRRITEQIGRPYWVIHSYCGGEPVLHAAVGDVVTVDGADWTVIAVHRLPLSGNADAVAPLEGDALLHACDLVAGRSVVVSIEPSSTQPSSAQPSSTQPSSTAPSSTESTQG